MGFRLHPLKARACRELRLIVIFGEPGSDYPLKMLTCQGREET